MSGYTGLELLNAQHHHRVTVQHVCCALLSKADALDDIGMGALAEFLTDIAEQISFSAKALDAAYGADLTDQLRETQQQAGQILKALLDKAIAP